MECESDVGFSTRFQREEEIGLRLNHPYILKFIPITTPKSGPYLVTEYLRATLPPPLGHGAAGGEGCAAHRPPSARRFSTCMTKASCTGT